MIATKIDNFYDENAFNLTDLHFRKILEIPDFFKRKLQAQSAFSHAKRGHRSPPVWLFLLNRTDRNRSGVAHY
jgi:hypothetical protein